MKLQQRIELLENLNAFLSERTDEFAHIKQLAYNKNGWFTDEFVELQVKNICTHFLQREKLEKWVAHYHLDDNVNSINTGIVMAGNIPLVGFHDFLAVFISGHKQTVKLSSKDDVLLKFLVEKMTAWNPEMSSLVSFAERLTGCDAYIATGSNNSARAFEYYFSKYPSIIRRNRTSAAVLQGDESAAELEKLADDVHLYYGLGCRNVTKLYVPAGYDFVPLLRAFDKYNYFADHHKYRNNYDYYLSLLIMNSQFYMTNNSIILAENEALFTPVSVVNYEFYSDVEKVNEKLAGNPDVQCITGRGHIPFGSSQAPGLMDYADGVDTMQFLLGL